MTDSHVCVCVCVCVRARARATHNNTHARTHTHTPLHSPVLAPLRPPRVLDDVVVNAVARRARPDHEHRVVDRGLGAVGDDAALIACSGNT